MKARFPIVFLGLLLWPLAPANALASARDGTEEAAAAPVVEAGPGASERSKGGPFTLLNGHFAPARPNLMGEAAPGSTAARGENEDLFDTVGDLTGFRLGNDTSLAPYLGAGFEQGSALEFAVTPEGREPPEAASQEIAYKLGAGMECLLGDGAILDFGYRFMPNSIYDIGNPFHAGFGRGRDSHNISFDLEIRF